MTVVFVHGNPETSAIWGPLVAALGRDDVVLLSPPGFGAPLPEGFGATYLEYRDWLEAELEKIDGRLVEAAADLYSSPFTAFRTVTLPLSMPGLVAGTLLTFIPAAGDYINAELLGNPTTRMVGNEIQDLFAAGDYPTASSLSVTLMAAIERGEGASDNVIKGWLARALNAPRGPQWVCDNCNQVHAEWGPVCTNCQGFDTLSWRSPPHVEGAVPPGAEMLPLLIGTTDEPVEDVEDLPPDPDPERTARNQQVLDAIAGSGAKAAQSSK